MRASRRLLSTSLALATFASAPAARAEPPSDPVAAYRDAVARGQARFDAGDYAAAREAFEAAYAIHPDPVLQFNIASTFRREGAIELAIRHYRAFLAAAAADDPRRDLAAETIAALEAELAREPAAEVIVVDDADDPDDDAAAEADDAELAPLAPGAQPATPAAATPVAAGRAGPRADVVLRWAGVASGAAAVVAGGFAIASMRDASRAESQLEALDPGASWGWDDQALYDRGRSSQRAAVAWSVASAVLLGAGVALYVAGDRRAERAAITLAPTGDGAAVTLARPF